MKILVITATKPEIEPLLKKMESVRYIGRNAVYCHYRANEIDIVITGVGMVATAYYTAKAMDASYDAVFNLGICGTFNKNLEIGTVVNVYEDCFSEIGAEDGDTFLSLEDLNLEGITKITNDNGVPNAVIELMPKVNGITVNTVHGNDNSIEKVVGKFHPIVESMEGAAFMFACKNENIPHVQIRAVSNLVERRNRNAWNIPLAIANLNDAFLEILNTL